MKRIRKIYKIYPIVIGLLSAFLFGLAAPVCKYLIAGVNEFQLAGLLYIGAAIGVFPGIVKNNISRISKKENPIEKFSLSGLLKIAGVVLFGGLAAPLLLLLGLKSAHASSVAIWLNFELVATALLGLLFFKEQLGKYGWLGVCFTLSAGIIMAFSQGISSFIPALFVFCACLFWGIDNNLTSVIDCITPSTITFIKGAFAGFINLTIGLILFRSALSFETVFFSLVIGAFSYGVSILLYVKSAQSIGATRGQILFASAPIFSIIISVIFLNENFAIIELISVIFIFTGVYFSTKVSHGHKHIHKRIEHIHEHSHDDEHHNHNHINDIKESTVHTHLHSHEEIEHSHEHFPDIHHRHEHNG